MSAVAALESGYVCDADIIINVDDQTGDNDIDDEILDQHQCLKMFQDPWNTLGINKP